MESTKKARDANCPPPGGIFAGERVFPVPWQTRSEEEKRTVKPASKPQYASVEQPFGCGWCRREGGEAELREFVAERRAGTKA